MYTSLTVMTQQLFLHLQPETADEMLMLLKLMDLNTPSFL